MINVGVLVCLAMCCVSFGLFLQCCWESQFGQDSVVGLLFVSMPLGIAV